MPGSREAPADPYGGCDELELELQLSDGESPSTSRAASPDPLESAANPFDAKQRPGHDKTLKWCLWEVLARHYSQTGASLGQLMADERLLSLRPSLRQGKNRSGQIGGELCSEREHFARNFGGQEGVWAARLGRDQRTENVAPSTAAEAATAPHRGSAEAAAAPLSAAYVSPPVPGNRSGGKPWEGASCSYLYRKLYKLPVSVWWAGEQQFFEGKITNTLEEGALLLLEVTYEDQTVEWMEPTSFRVSGTRDSTIVVVKDHVVYIKSETEGRYVPDPNQGEEPPTSDGADVTADEVASAVAEAAARVAGEAQPEAAQQQQQQQRRRQEEQQRERQQEHQQQRQQQQQPAHPKEREHAGTGSAHHSLSRQRKDTAAAEGQAHPHSGRHRPEQQQRQQQQHDHAVKKRRRAAETEAEEDEPRQQRKKQQAVERAGKEAGDTAGAAGGGAAAGGTKHFSIPKRPSTEQPAGDDHRVKPTGEKAAFRIPKAGAAAAAAPAAERPVSKRARPEAAGPPEQRHHQQEQRHHQQQQPAAQHRRPGAAQAQQQPVRQRSPPPREAVRRRSPPPREAALNLGQELLRKCSSELASSLGRVRWKVPASEAQLPALPAEPAAAAAAAAPHLAALAARLAAGGAWPHGVRLLPPNPVALEQLPDSFMYGRIFISKRETLSACMERKLFVSNSHLDMVGLCPGMLVLMHSLDERLIYGCYKVVEFGLDLDPTFPAPGFRHHVRVAPVRLFQPVPAELLDSFCDRKLHSKTGAITKFFDRHLNQKQCKQIWALLKFYQDRLHPELDVRYRLSSQFGSKGL